MKSRTEVTPPEELIQRHRAFWERIPVDRPLVRLDSASVRFEFPSVASVYGAQAGTPITPHQADADRFLAAIDWSLVLEPGGADLFDVLPPYVRIPWAEAVAGCRVIPHPTSDSIWSKEPDPPRAAPRAVSPDPGWLGALEAQARRLAEDERLPCPTGQTLLRGPGDVAEALLGGEALCLAMMDEAEWLGPLLHSCTDIIIRAARCQLDVIPPLWGGYFNVFGFHSPAPCVRVQEDVQRILTPPLYRRWLRPCLARIVAAFPFSMFHIHSGSLNMVDEVISVPGLDALEVAVDEPPYAAPVTDQIDLFRRIQDRVPLFIQGRMTRAEVDALTGGLSPRGLGIRASSWVRDGRRF